MCLQLYPKPIMFYIYKVSPFFGFWESDLTHSVTVNGTSRDNRKTRGPPRGLPSNESIMVTPLNNYSSHFRSV